MPYDARGKKRPRRRNVMKEFRIDEISGVDRPAQAGAVVTMFKRSDPDGSLEKRFAVLSSEDGHQHLVDVMGPDGTRQRGFTTFDDGHSHEWVRREDGSLVVLEAEGHSHGVDEMIDALDKRAVEAGGDPGQQGLTEDAMTTKTEDKGVDVAALQADLEKVRADLAEATALAGMSDAQKAHLAKLEGDERGAFVKMDGAARDAELAKVAEDDPVVYTTSAGVEIRKSAGAAIAAMAKQNDDLTKRVVDSEAKAERAELAKRAETELRHLPGSVEHRAALLKAVDGIEDKDEREGAMAALKAQDARVSAAFKQVGVTDVTKADDGEESAEDQLNKLAKAHAEEHKIDFYTAYDAVGEANPDLLARAVQG